MSTLVAIPVTLAGVALILVALHDVFHTLFHPGGRTPGSHAIMRVVWRAFKPIAVRRQRTVSLAGPVALICIVVSWAAALIAGWALIYWPHVPESFAFEPDGRHGGLGGLVDAVYLSLVTISTLGYGDVTPAAAWLRMLTPLEALVGFALLSASITWLGSLYPALQRRRSLAYEIYLMREAQGEAGVEVVDLEPDSAGAFYGDLIGRIVTAERDLVAFPILYYFAETDERFALPVAIPYAWDLALQGADADVDDRARLRAVMLRDAIADFATTVAERFHGDRSDDTEDRLATYARDHLVEALETP